jgi:hypothetical protein
MIESVAEAGTAARAAHVPRAAGARFGPQLAAGRAQARRRADECNAALPEGTFWQKVDWLKSH